MGPGSRQRSAPPGAETPRPTFWSVHMITENTTINGPRGPMQTYIARRDEGPRPAVIVLEGIYGFDAELRRITDLVASAGYVGCAIDYLRGQDVAHGFHTATIADDIAMTR